MKQRFRRITVCNESFHTDLVSLKVKRQDFKWNSRSSGTKWMLKKTCCLSIPVKRRHFNQVQILWERSFEGWERAGDFCFRRFRICRALVVLSNTKPLNRQRGTHGSPTSLRCERIHQRLTWNENITFIKNTSQVHSEGGRIQLILVLSIYSYFHSVWKKKKEGPIFYPTFHLINYWAFCLDIVSLSQKSTQYVCTTQARQQRRLCCKKTEMIQ